MTLFDVINLTSPGSTVEIVVVDAEDDGHLFLEVLYQGIALYYPHDFDTQDVVGIEALKNGTLRFIL